MTVYKYLLTFAAGFGVAAVWFLVIVLLDEAEKKLQFGRKHGFVDGLIHACGAIEKEFGLYDEQSPCRNVLSMKQAAVVAIDVDGVKTIRANW